MTASTRLQTATAMVVLSLKKDADLTIIESKFDLSRTLSIVGLAQAVRIGNETLAVMKVAYTARGANRSMISRSLGTMFTEDEIVHVTTTNVERHE